MPKPKQLAKRRKLRFWRYNLSNHATNSPPSDIPKHVAVIMDGNGRWAKHKGQHRAKGHEAGADNIREVAQAFREKGVDYLTLYAFSTENWHRPRQEITSLLSILSAAVDKQAEALHRDGVRLLHIGRLDRISRILRRKIENIIKMTERNNGLTLVLAFDYGGRSEIIEAIRKIVNDGQDAENIDETTYKNYIFISGIYSLHIFKIEVTKNSSLEILSNK